MIISFKVHDPRLKYVWCPLKAILLFTHSLASRQPMQKQLSRPIVDSPAPHYQQSSGYSLMLRLQEVNYGMKLSVPAEPGDQDSRKRI